MSPASGNLKESIADSLPETRFHSINVPSEWEHNAIIMPMHCTSSLVSIQLMSPASGNKLKESSPVSRAIMGFHSINVPSEWEPVYNGRPSQAVVVFPFN